MTVFAAFDDGDVGGSVAAGGFGQYGFDALGDLLLFCIQLLDQALAADAGTVETLRRVPVKQR